MKYCRSALAERVGRTSRSVGASRLDISFGSLQYAIQSRVEFADSSYNYRDTVTI